MNFAVIGAGAWGTAFALHLARLGHAVSLVPRRPEQAAALAQTRENRDYLPGLSLPPALHVTADTGAALAAAEVILIACPAQSLRATCERLRAAGPGRARLLVSLSKGLELGTHLRASEVIAQAWAEPAVGSLGGPTNALEVARGQPAAMVLATARAGALAR
jgi:glycerol-3-phosphate dehydrogenase (NAD(P)+)